VYGFGRLFEPFSFENVDPRAQLSICRINPLAQFDLKPGAILFSRRDGIYRSVPVRSASDLAEERQSLIDDTQVGVTLLHQDIILRRRSPLAAGCLLQRRSHEVGAPTSQSRIPSHTIRDARRNCWPRVLGLRRISRVPTTINVTA
jgi:hypothetical protein